MFLMGFITGLFARGVLRRVDHRDTNFRQAQATLIGSHSLTVGVSDKNRFCRSGACQQSEFELLSAETLPLALKVQNEQGEIGPGPFRHACLMAWRGHAIPARHLKE